MSEPHPVLRCIDEAEPGPRWAAEFERLWPHYRRWYESAGRDARPDRRACERALARHMPEMLEVWEALVDVVDGDDLVARCLSLWRPPPVVAACTQACATRGEPTLVRNYDYPPHLWEAVLLRSAWRGRPTLAMTDCLVGVLDGINEAGLAVSLNFGGRRAVGEGFGAPMLLRHLLETCETTSEAAAVVARVPTHMAYNLLLLDRHGDYVTAFTAAGGRARFKRVPLSTNHQGRVFWVAHAEATDTVARERHLMAMLAADRPTGDELVQAFLAPPIHNEDLDSGAGTLYTAAWQPTRGRLVLHWPDRRLEQGLEGGEFQAGTFDLPAPVPTSGPLRGEGSSRP